MKSAHGKMTVFSKSMQEEEDNRECVQEAEDAHRKTTVSKRRGRGYRKMAVCGKRTTLTGRRQSVHEKRKRL